MNESGAPTGNQNSFDQRWKRWEQEYWASLEARAPDANYRRQYGAYKTALGFRGLSKSQQRDFDFYRSGQDVQRYQSISWIPQRSRFYYEPKSIEEWYWLWDTHGIATAFRDWKLGAAITQQKEWTNLTIKMWVEDVLNWLLRPYEVEEYCKDSPDWVWQAFKNQMNKCAIYFWQRVP